MANVDIKPEGFTTADLVDVLYMWWASLKGICQKLDADSGVPLATYTANAIAAIMNGSIGDSRGNSINNAVAAKADRYYIIGPEGCTADALTECLYDMLDAAETLAEQLDADTLSFSNYEATAYTPVCTQLVENARGSVLGNGTAVFRFAPGGVRDTGQLVEFLYNAVRFIYLVTHGGGTTGLDSDATAADANYEALWYTAGITRVIENAAGNTIGNARKY